MSEKQLMDGLISWAQQLGFLVAHIPDALYAIAAGQGRYEALAGAKGLPDLIICGHGHLLVLECKTATGRVDAAQLEWLDAFAGVSNDRLHVMVVRPDDYDNTIELMRQCREESWRAA